MYDSTVASGKLTWCWHKTIFIAFAAVKMNEHPLSVNIGNLQLYVPAKTFSQASADCLFFFNEIWTNQCYI